jgi:hypothetical protein
MGPLDLRAFHPRLLDLPALIVPALFRPLALFRLLALFRSLALFNLPFGSLPDRFLRTLGPLTFLPLLLLVLLLLARDSRLLALLTRLIILPLPALRHRRFALLRCLALH